MVILFQTISDHDPYRILVFSFHSATNQMILKMFFFLIPLGLCFFICKMKGFTYINGFSTVLWGTHAGHFKGPL